MSDSGFDVKHMESEMLRKFVVELDVDRHVKGEEIKDHIRDSIRGWGGACHPDDWRFNLDTPTVKFYRAVRSGGIKS